MSLRTSRNNHYQATFLFVSAPLWIYGVRTEQVLLDKQLRQSPEQRRHRVRRRDPDVDGLAVTEVVAQHIVLGRGRRAQRNKLRDVLVEVHPRI